jgi:PAS domain S-box-containing protein
MSELIRPAVWIFTGLCLSTALYHFYRAKFDSQRAAHISLALMALAVAAYSPTNTLMQHAGSIDQWVWLAEVRYALGALALTMFALFARAYTGLPGWRGFAAVAGLHASFAALVFIFGKQAVAPGLQHLIPVQLSTGEILFQPQEFTSTRLAPFLIPIYATFLYAMYACRYLKQQGERRLARAFAIALGIVTAGYVLATLNAYIGFSSVIMPEFGFIGMMVIMTLNLSVNLAEGHYRAFVEESTPVACVEFDPPVPMDIPPEDQLRLIFFNGRVVKVNSAFIRDRGGSLDDYSFKPVGNFTFPEDPENVRNYLATVQAKYRIRGVKVHDRGLSGNDVYYINDFYGEYESGYLTRLWLSQQNITEQKRAEELAQRRGEGLELALNAAHMGVWRWDLQTGTVDWSDTVAPLFGLKKEEFDGTLEAYLKLIHRDDLSLVRAAVRQLRAAVRLKSKGLRDEFRLLEHRVVWPDGSIHWIEGRGRIRFAEDGTVVTMAGTVADISERKYSEEQLRESADQVLRLNAELEERVERRTEELRAANRELESFSYSVSHDLRAPLRNISGFATLLKESAKELDSESKYQLDTITKEVSRMAALIDDLLELSRIGRLEMLFQTVDGATVVGEVLDSFKMEIQSRSIEWRIGELPVVRADRLLLRQVFANLISNAIKYTKYRDGAIIEVGCLREESSGKENVFFIRDNGVGFDMQYAGKLFGVFQRLHSARQFEGTGVGLANVQRIVHRHGGKVWADGAVNNGATFFFSLPV